MSEFLLGILIGLTLAIAESRLNILRPKTNDKLTVWNTASDEWHWHRQAGNNEIISQGESYETKQGGLKGAFRANPDMKEVWLKQIGVPATVLKRKNVL